jgi:PRTRC genetic system protein A
MKKLNSNIKDSEKLISLIGSNFENIIGRNQNIIVQRYNKWTTITVQDIIAPFEKFEYTGEDSLIMDEKIPVEYLIQSFKFFKEVHKKHKTEAFTLIVRNKETDKISLYIPNQVVSSALVNYTLPDGFNKEYEILINLHSHHVMKISFSSTDDKDDKGQTTISGVIRNIYDSPEIDLRVWSINKFIDLDVRDIFDFDNIDLVITLDDYLSYPNLLDLLEHKYKVSYNPNWIKKIKKPIISTYKNDKLNNLSKFNNRKNAPVYYDDPMDEYDIEDYLADRDYPRKGWSK